MTSEQSAPAQYAVWFFIAATFVFAAPTIYFQGSAELWVTILTFAAGLVLVILGGIRLGTEMRGRRRRAVRPPGASSGGPSGT